MHSRRAPPALLPSPRSIGPVPTVLCSARHLTERREITSSWAAGRGSSARSEFIKINQSQMYNSRFFAIMLAFGFYKRPTQQQPAFVFPSPPPSRSPSCPRPDSLQGILSRCFAALFDWRCNWNCFPRGGRILGIQSNIADDFGVHLFRFYFMYPFMFQIEYRMVAIDTMFIYLSIHYIYIYSWSAWKSLRDYKS